MKTNTQTNKVSEWLNEGRPLTPLMAVQLFGCIHLSRIIGKLRKKGLNIKTTMRKTSDGVYAEYSLQ